MCQDTNPVAFAEILCLVGQIDFQGSKITLIESKFHSTISTVLDHILRSPYFLEQIKITAKLIKYEN